MREALLEAYRAADTHDTYYMVCLACTWAGKVAQALDTYKTLANGTPRLRPLDCHSVCTTHMLPAYATGTVHKDRQTRRQTCLQRFPQTPVDTKRPADLDVVVGSMVCDRKHHLADREELLWQQK